MGVLDVTIQIVFVTNRVLPEAALPDVACAMFGQRRRKRWVRPGLRAKGFQQGQAFSPRIRSKAVIRGGRSVVTVSHICSRST